VATHAWCLAGRDLQWLNKAVGVTSLVELATNLVLSGSRYLGVIEKVKVIVDLLPHFYQ